jgi:hypothetical protein
MSTPPPPRLESLVCPHTQTHLHVRRGQRAVVRVWCGRVYICGQVYISAKCTYAARCSYAPPDISCLCKCVAHACLLYPCSARALLSVTRVVCKCVAHACVAHSCTGVECTRACVVLSSTRVSVDKEYLFGSLRVSVDKEYLFGSLRVSVDKVYRGVRDKV